MSEEQLKAFLEKVKGDTSLQEKLKAAKSPEDVVDIAKEHGYEFTADKINQLSERELEGVSGGAASTFVGDCQSQEGHVCFSEGEVVCGKR
ncbi:Nif11-like leader peptide family natural product precursor [Synechococcus sp. BIOS-E4-1]|uniref:Nif11-like leader peptide family natural product precursor n=1 Tax=Synechococcus sp. BIOS-E4-1 TaxID=1400864 RepID=UPI001646C829|nr:Nif11-like leader peptide family natural product precursor [Synechococcus sp. BIOS-E4-1]